MEHLYTLKIPTDHQFINFEIKMNEINMNHNVINFKFTFSRVKHL